MLIFSSSINAQEKDNLEQIMFFNKNQGQFYFDIVKLVDTFGEPEIIEENGQLHITLPRIDCQNIFASMNNNLAGVLIFNRNSADNIDLVHIVVGDKYSYTGEYADEMLVLRMINELKKIALMIKNIKTIHINYGKEYKQESILDLTRK